MQTTKGMTLGDAQLIEKRASASGRELWVGEHLEHGRVLVERADPDWRRDSSALLCFHGNAKAAEQLAHRHVVRVLGHGLDEDKRPFVVREWVGSETLRDRVEAKGPLGLRAAGRMVEELLTALDALHAAGLAREGVTPDAIHVGDGAKLWFELIAPPGRSFLTAPGRGDDDGDPRTSLWEVAAVAYFAMTGRAPFASAGDAASRPGSFPRLALRGQGGEASRIELDAFFRVALAAEPEQRHAGAAEMLDAWQSVVGGLMLFVGEGDDGAVEMIDAGPTSTRRDDDVDTVAPPRPYEDEATKIFPRMLLRTDDSAITRLASLLDDNGDDEATKVSDRDAAPESKPEPAAPLVSAEPRVVILAKAAPPAPAPQTNEAPPSSERTVRGTDRPIVTSVSPSLGSTPEPRRWNPQMLVIGVVVAALSSGITSWFSNREPAVPAQLPAAASAPEPVCAPEPVKAPPPPAPCTAAVAIAATAASAPSGTSAAPTLVAPTPAAAYPPMKAAPRPNADPYGAVD
jgi:serine/threonine protein kinase